MSLELEGLNLHAGFPLITKNPQTLTNAVVFEIQDEQHIKVLTDFGNMRIISLNSLSFDYTVSASYEDILVSSGRLNTEELYSLGCRLLKQIHNLDEVFDIHFKLVSGL